MNHQIGDIGKLIETHCHDCHEDVDGTVVQNGEAIVQPVEGEPNEMKVDVTIPLAYQCPKCNGLNCGPVTITFTIPNEELGNQKDEEISKKMGYHQWLVSWARQYGAKTIADIVKFHTIKEVDDIEEKSEQMQEQLVKHFKKLQPTDWFSKLLNVFDWVGIIFISTCVIIACIGYAVRD